MPPPFLPKVMRFKQEAASRGVSLHFTSAFRPPGAQARIHADRKSHTLAAAGWTLHEAGFAVDVNWNYLQGIPGGKTKKQQQDAIVAASKAAGISWGVTSINLILCTFISNPAVSVWYG